jgi:hypothetical protein
MLHRIIFAEDVDSCDYLSLRRRRAGDVPAARAALPVAPRVTAPARRIDRSRSGLR